MEKAPTQFNREGALLGEDPQSFLIFKHKSFEFANEIITRKAVR